MSHQYLLHPTSTYDITMTIPSPGMHKLYPPCSISSHKFTRHIFDLFLKWNQHVIGESFDSLAPNQIILNMQMTMKSLCPMFLPISFMVGTI